MSAKIDVADIGLRLVSSVLFTGTIGLDRSARDRASGLRPHALVGVGSALLTILSIDGFRHFGNGDPARLAAQIVSGIGFLGAGAILQFGASVRGMTTAATIWVSAAIGIACGVGMYIPALMVSVLAFAIVEWLGRLEKRLHLGERGRRLWIWLQPQARELDNIESLLRDRGAALQQVKVAFDARGKKLLVVSLVDPLPDAVLLDVMRALSGLPGVERVED